ncbi:LOW QUALITY PROTEIN: cell wall protein DAN4-like [Haliotis rubra]|uniref:LOW QUALITY PROTEIN: cell wall protein DAN4-like n=1 Tax=Haliotis rubra TaxID=36100 RepID=UPI001EE583BF|nr:LOW QUALITY PROTEIN: cell wall protein DAN4-like [Haliotis rubra]
MQVLLLVILSSCLLQGPMSRVLLLAKAATALPINTTAEPETTSELDITAEPETSTEPETTAEPETSSEPETTAEPETSSEPETTAEPETSSEPETTAEPETSSEPETTAEPETSSEPETTAEPETSSEPGTATAEPETSSEPELHAEPETSSEPETQQNPRQAQSQKPQQNSETSSEPETTAEPETSSEPETTAEPETSSEPETTAEPETSSEPETTAEPETSSEPETTAEPETSSEPETTAEPETSSEPETTAEPETSSEPETTAEPETSSEPETTAEPETSSEPETTAEPETSSEPETTAEPETSSEPETTAEPETSSEPETTAEPVSEKGAVPETRPSVVEIVVPPFALMAVIVLGLVFLVLKARFTTVPSALLSMGKSAMRAMWLQTAKVSCELKPKIISTENNNKEKLVKDADDEFLTPFDIEVIDSLRTSHNRPQELIRIALPAVLSLALCPLTLYLYEPFTLFLWPKDQYATPPDINDAIACFLAPAGLVYATSFGFAFQSALNKQHEILTKMTGEMSMIDHIATFTTKIRLPNKKLRLDIYRAIKAEAIFMILQLLDRDESSYVNRPKEDVKVKIWTVVDILRQVDTDSKHHVDRVLLEKIISNIVFLNSVCSDRMGILHARIHPLKWAFLETLGFFSFIGILLLHAYSYRMELVMCIITVFSISMLCYVVSDLDSPFSGFFRVDLSVLEVVIERLAAMYELAKMGHSNLVFYPDKHPAGAHKAAEHTKKKPDKERVQAW